MIISGVAHCPMSFVTVPLRYGGPNSSYCFAISGKLCAVAYVLWYTLWLGEPRGRNCDIWITYFGTFSFVHWSSYINLRLNNGQHVVLCIRAAIRSDGPRSLPLMTFPETEKTTLPVQVLIYHHFFLPVSALMCASSCWFGIQGGPCSPVSIGCGVPVSPTVTTRPPCAMICSSTTRRPSSWRSFFPRGLGKWIECVLYCVMWLCTWCHLLLLLFDVTV